MELVVRPLSGQSEYHECAALQRDIWGADFLDVVPPSVLQVTQRIGGVASGAFRGSRLVGFVFGLTGIRHGEMVHWSDMLAVREEARNTGVAKRLKAHQRELVARAGVRSMYWTFDPLVARNAHFNFNTLGVELDEYVVNMYGTTGSQLHGGLDTDRFVVRWSIDARAPKREPLDDPAAESSDRAFTIEIPADFETLLTTDTKAAAEWRQRTRAQFLRALEDGYEVRGVQVERTAGRAVYLLGRRSA